LHRYRRCDVEPGSGAANQQRRITGGVRKRVSTILKNTEGLRANTVVHRYTDCRVSVTGNVKLTQWMGEF
jgi:hypothetical protein